jgi:hypothetical protein
MTDKRGQLKPIAEFRFENKHIVIDFAKNVMLGRGSIKYDIFVNNRRVHTNFFAEEVMRWMANLYHQEETQAAE